MRAAAEQRPAVTSWLVTARRLLFRCWRKPSTTRLIPFSPNLADTHMQMCARVSPLLGKENFRTP
jgi:hypothetical protein